MGCCRTGFNLGHVIVPGINLNNQEGWHVVLTYP